MSDLRTRILIDLTGNLESRARRYGDALGDMGRRGRRSMGLLASGVGAAGRGLDRLGNRYAALITGAAGVAAARQVMNLQERLTMLGIGASVGAEEMEALKQQIFEVSRSPEIRIDPSRLIAALEAVADRTGGLEHARENLRNIAIALRATGDQGPAIGEIVGHLHKMGIVEPARIMEALDLLASMGKDAGMKLDQWSRYGTRLIETYASLGRDGVPAVRELGATMRVIMDGMGGDARRATAAAESMLLTLSDPEKVRELERLSGIKVWDPAKLAAGERVLRPLNELMTELATASKGDLAKLGMVFEDTGAKAFIGLANEMRRAGGPETLERFMAIQADGTTITRDSARAANDAGASLRNLYTAWQQFADSELTGPIQSLADFLNSLDKETVDRWLQMGRNIAYTAAALYAARKVFQAGAGIAGLLGAVAGRRGLPGTGGIAAGPGGSAAGAAGAGLGAGAAVTAALAAPAAVAAMAAGSMWLGQKIAEKEAASSASDELLALAGRHMVMGGGANSYQVGLIERELAGRGEDLARALGGMGGGPRDNGPELMRGEVTVRVRADKGLDARAMMARSSGPLDLEAESEVGFVAGGGW